jgi:CubicO group peptidase (beta-lactamase class C family)
MVARHSSVGNAALFLVLLLAGAPAARGEFQATHGLTSAGYQEWVARMVKGGYRIVQVNGYDVGGEANFAAVAIKEATSPAWEARHDRTADQHQTDFDALTGKGFRLASISGYLSGDTPRVATLWVRDRRPIRWEAAHNLTSREYQDRLTALEKNRLRPDIVSGYGDGKGSYRLAATFVEAGNTPWVARHDLTAEEYQKVFDQFAPQGYRPISVSVYPTQNGRRFATVFLKDGAGGVAKQDLTAEAYQAAIEREAKAGFRPLLVAGYSEGKPSSLEAFDTAIRTFMKERTIKGGTLAVSRDGKLVLSRGYGFTDEAGTQPMPADAPFRLASLNKPITAAAIRDLVRQGKLSLDTKVFPLLDLQPLPGQKPDPRLPDITVKHLLAHQGGWDRDRAGDPMNRPLEIAEAFGKLGPAEPEEIIRWMLGQPLQFAPGSHTSYSNFGYCVLGRVIEKVTGRSYVAHIRTHLLAPLKIESIELARSLPKDRNPREPVYLDPGKGRNVIHPRSKELVPNPDGTFYVEAMDSHGGLIGSAPDLIRFLDAYWATGERREGGSGTYEFFGSLPGTWTMMQQRPNGVNVVALFNQRTDPSGLSYEKLAEVTANLADRLTVGTPHFTVIWVKDE